MLRRKKITEHVLNSRKLTTKLIPRQSWHMNEKFKAVKDYKHWDYMAKKGLLQKTKFSEILLTWTPCLF